MYVCVCICISIYIYICTFNMHVYMYVYMYICVCVCVNNYGKDLWTAVPHVLEHIRKGLVKKSPRLYGRRYLV